MQININTLKISIRRILFVMVLLNTLCTLLFLYLCLNSDIPFILDYAPNQFPPIRLKWVIPSELKDQYHYIPVIWTTYPFKICSLRVVPIIIESVVAKNPGALFIRQASENVKLDVIEGDSMVKIIVEFLIVTIEN